MMKRIARLTLMVLLLGVAAAEAVVLVQCPCTSDPTAIPAPPVFPALPVVNAEGNIECTIPGSPPRNIVCKTLAAGDGFIRMADGDPGFPETYTPLYTFGFSDMTGQPSGDILSTSLLKANFAAPVISIKEGQEFYLTLCNVGLIARADLFDPHTVHFHGFPNASPFFDGETMGSLAPVVGACFTYYYNLVDPGTYMYHCHVEATEHMQMGMLGNLYVRPVQDDNAALKDLGLLRTPPSAYTGFAYNDGDGSTGYDVAYPMQIHGMDPDFHNASIGIQPLNFANLSLPNADRYPMLNGRGYPDTIVLGPLPPPIIEGFAGEVSQKTSSLIEATVGQKILLRISNLSFHFKTLRVLGIPMKVVGKDSKLLRGPTNLNLSYNTNSITLGGGQSADVILDTTTNIAGTYFLYTTNLNHLSNNQQERGGMMTTIVLSP
jgi:FtsP/CotA-like multicopper oxidase with cupredoxin domain